MSEPQVIYEEYHSEDWGSDMKAYARRNRREIALEYSGHFVLRGQADQDSDPHRVCAVKWPEPTRIRPARAVSEDT